MTRADLSDALRADGCSELEIAEAWRDPHVRMFVARASLRPRRSAMTARIVERRELLQRSHPDVPAGWGFS